MAQFSRSHHHLSNYLRLSLMLLVPWGLLLSLSNNQLLVRGASGIPPPHATVLSEPSNFSHGNISGIPQNQSSDCSRNICEEGEVCRAVECPCPENYVAMPPVGTFGKTCLPTTKLGCPEGWDTLTGADRCYRVFKRFQVSRQEASELCRMEHPNAQLAAVPSKAIANFIIYKIGEVNFDRDQPNSTENRKVWMGLMQTGSTWSDRPDGEPVSRFAMNLKYWESEINRPGDSSKCTVIDVRRDEREYYYYSAGFCLRKHSCDNVTHLAGFMCDVPRTLPEFEQPLRSIQFYVKTCCNNSTPILTQEGKETVSHWMLNGNPRDLAVDKGCFMYFGSFMIGMDTFHSYRSNKTKLANVLIDCDCPIPGQDARCHEQCGMEYYQYKSPFDNSTEGRGQRCSNGSFVGILLPVLALTILLGTLGICYCCGCCKEEDKPDDADCNQSSQDANEDGRNCTMVSVDCEEEEKATNRIQLPGPANCQNCQTVIDDQPPSYDKARLMISVGDNKVATGEDKDGDPPSYAEALEM